MTPTVRQATHALMRELGMTTMFGNPGSTELRFFRDWPEDFRYVLALQESSAVAMADGYAQATRNAALVVVVLGAPVFTYHVHSEGPYVPDDVRLFQLVDDPSAAARAPVGTAVLTTLRPAIARILEALPALAPGASSPRRELPPPAVTDPIRPELVMSAVRRLMPADAIVVEEAPTHRNAMHQHLPITTSGGFYVAASGGLGWGLYES